MPARAVIAVAVLVVAFAALTAAHPAAAPRRTALRPAEAIFAFSARARASDTSQVFVVLAGGRVRQLTHEPGDVELRGWTADGA
jgi:hypothetical protein